MSFSHSAAAARMAADTVAARDADTAASASTTTSPSGASPSSSLGWFASSLSSRAVSGDASLRLVADASAGGGRGIVLGNGARPGETLIQEAAFIASLTSNQLDARCAACWQVLKRSAASGGGGGDDAAAAAPPVVAAKRCSACQVARYCSGACQAAHWTRAHKLECSCLRHYKGRAASAHPAHLPSVWFVAQLVLWTIQRPMHEFRTSQLDAGTRSTPTWQAQEKVRREALEKHLVGFDEWVARWHQTEGNLDQHSPERRQRYAEAATAVREVTLHVCANQAERELHSRLFPLDWLVLAFARLACNGFSVCDDELRPIGLALFPSVSMVNHSCAPACCATFTSVGAPGAATRITLRSMRPVAPGEQLTISYVGLAQNAAGRRRELRDQYFFDCQCPRCVASEEAHRDDPPAPLVDPTTRSGGEPKNEWRRNREMDALMCEHAWKYDAGNRVDDDDASGQQGRKAASAMITSTSSTSSASSSRPPCPGIIVAHSVHPTCSTCHLAHNLSFLQAKLKADVLWAMARVEAIKGEVKYLAAGTGGGGGGTTADSKVVPHERLRQMLVDLPRCLQALGRIFTPVSTLRLIALEQLVLVAIELQEWPLAKATVEETLPLYAFYYSEANRLDAHPLRGLQYAMHAKLAWLVEDSRAALASWLKARTILSITHGPQHEMVRTMEQESIPQAKMEIAQLDATKSNSKAMIKEA